MFFVLQKVSPFVIYYQFYKNQINKKYYQIQKGS